MLKTIKDFIVKTLCQANPDPWSRKTTGPEDYLWDAAEKICARLAREHNFDYYPGRGCVPPWLGNTQHYAKYRDRVVAYHGFVGTWVGWERNGEVIPLAFEQIVPYLLEE
jgi:hypothetical protein